MRKTWENVSNSPRPNVLGMGRREECCCWWEKEITTEKFAVAEEMGIWVPPSRSAWGFRLRRRNMRRAAVGSLKETQVI